MREVIITVKVQDRSWSKNSSKYRLSELACLDIRRKRGYAWPVAHSLNNFPSLHHLNHIQLVMMEKSKYEELEDIVKLASQSLPERPDGIVTVAKYTSASEPECRSTEAEYERMARNNPATLFLRCFKEYEDTDQLFGVADVTVFPTFDVFYGGNRVARVVGGPDHVEVEELLERYQFQNSRLDLFSESAGGEKWGDGRRVKDASKTTPRTTARFVPGYDWDKDKGFFDDVADKAQNDFENQFGNWLPNTEDE